MSLVQMVRNVVLMVVVAAVKHLWTLLLLEMDNVLWLRWRLLIHLVPVIVSLMPIVQIQPLSVVLRVVVVLHVPKLPPQIQNVSNRQQIPDFRRLSVLMVLAKVLFMNELMEFVSGSTVFVQPHLL
jgi:hypothetical protein